MKIEDCPHATRKRTVVSCAIVQELTGSQIRFSTAVCSQCIREQKELGITPSLDNVTPAIQAFAPQAKSFPKLWRRAWNFAKAIRKHIASGWKYAIAFEQRRRISICRKCDFHARRYGEEFCSHPECGCPLSRKTLWDTAECPIGKWDQAGGPGGAPGSSSSTASGSSK